MGCIQVFLIIEYYNCIRCKHILSVQERSHTYTDKQWYWCIYKYRPYVVHSRIAKCLLDYVNFGLLQLSHFWRAHTGYGLAPHGIWSIHQKPKQKKNPKKPKQIDFFCNHFFSYKYIHQCVYFRIISTQHL